MKDRRDVFTILITIFFIISLCFNFSNSLQQEKEDILFIYNDSDKIFTLFPLDGDKESYQLPINTTINLSIIRDKRYNESFARLVIPEGMPYKYLRGFVSSRQNKSLVLLWR
jgi:hypothetical protein